MKLEGSLDVFPLRELIEMTVYSSVTGVINIYNQHHHGQIFFHDGQAYHAVYDEQKKGVEALSEMFGETVATFAFIADTTIEEETLFGDVFDLMENAERMAVRWNRVRRLVPDMHIVPVLICPTNHARFSISPEHWTIFTAIDGERSIANISETLNIDLIEVCEAMAQMCDDHLIELRQVRYVHPVLTALPTDKAPSTASTRPDGGILGRLIANMPSKTEGLPIKPTNSKGNGKMPLPAEPVYVSEVDQILQLLQT